MPINFSNIWRYITSRKFAVYLLVVILAIFLIGSSLPNVAFMQAYEVEQLKRSDPIIYWLSSLINPVAISRSFYFYIVYLLLLNSVTVCTFRRLRGHLVSKQKSFPVPQKKILKSEKSYTVTTRKSLKTVHQKLIILLRDKKWKIKHREKNIIVVESGEIGFWGSILFHLSLILLSIGAIVTGLARFEAQLLLTEGLTIPLDSAIVNMQKSLFVGLPNQSVVSLNKIDTKYTTEETLTDISAKITIGNLYGYKQQSVKVNSPLNFYGYSIMPKSYGIAPKFAFADLKNNKKESFNVNLGDWLPGSWTEKGRTDKFELLDTSYTVVVQFVPNLKIDKYGKVTSQGKLVKNPALILRIKDKDNKQIIRGVVKQGESIKFHNYELKFAELNYWGSFFMVKDSGLPVVIFSVILAIIGLTVRFIFYKKSIRFSVISTENVLKIEIAGKASYFPVIFDNEMKLLRDDLANMLKGKS